MQSTLLEQYLNGGRVWRDMLISNLCVLECTFTFAKIAYKNQFMYKLFTISNTYLKKIITLNFPNINDPVHNYHFQHVFLFVNHLPSKLTDAIKSQKTESYYMDSFVLGVILIDSEWKKSITINTLFKLVWGNYLSLIATPFLISTTKVKLWAVSGNVKFWVYFVCTRKRAFNGICINRIYIDKLSWNFLLSITSWWIPVIHTKLKNYANKFNCLL